MFLLYYQLLIYEFCLKIILDNFFLSRVTVTIRPEESILTGISLESSPFMRRAEWLEVSAQGSPACG